MNRGKAATSDKPLAQDAPISDSMSETSTSKYVKKTWMPAVPFFAVMLVFTVGVFALAIIPTCVQVFSSSSGSIEDLGSRILKSVLLNLSFQLQQKIGTAKSIFDTFAKLEIVKKTLGTTTEGFGDNLELIRATYAILANSPVAVNLLCYQNYNITGNAPKTGKPTNVYGGSLIYQFYNYCDYKNTTHCFRRNYDPVSNKLSDPTVFTAFTPETAKDSFMYSKMTSCTSGGTWKPEVTYQLGWMTYAVCAAPNSNGKVPYVCGGGLSVLQLPSILEYLAPTPDTRVWLTTTDGRLISSNLNVTEYPFTNDMVTDYVPIMDFKDKTIVELSKKLLEGKSSWKNISTFDSANVYSMSSNQSLPTNEYVLSDGSKWITIALHLSFGTIDKFYLVVSIPREDFFALVDNSIKNGIILSSVFSALGVAVGLIITIMVVIPMHRLTENMKLVGKFDFSLLQSGVLREDSIFTEVRLMQGTFNTMVKAFAGGIRMNKNATSNVKSGVTSQTSGKFI